MTYITTDHGRKKTPVAQFSSPPLHSLILYLCCCFCSCSFSLSFRHPSFISILSPTAAWRVITPHFDERNGVYVWVFSLFRLCVRVCVRVSKCLRPVCVPVVYSVLLKWYGRQGGWLGDPTNLLLGKHHLFTQNPPPPPTP